jgi:hypothetical protein
MSCSIWVMMLCIYGTDIRLGVGGFCIGMALA